MRITAMVIFILCINLASALVGSFGLFITDATDSNSDKFIETINDTVSNQSYTGSAVTSSSVLQAGADFVTGLFTFIKIFFIAIALPNQMLMNFGVSSDIAMYMTIPIYFLYLVALIQMISGRYVE